MNKEMAGRLKKAKEYEKKAVHALFPENVSPHIEVIERECHAMFVEMVSDILLKEQADNEQKKAENNISKIKKVNID